jgi:hypothetical protein
MMHMLCYDTFTYGDHCPGVVPFVNAAHTPYLLLSVAAVPPAAG